MPPGIQGAYHEEVIAGKSAPRACESVGSLAVRRETSLGARQRGMVPSLISSAGAVEKRRY